MEIKKTGLDVWLGIMISSWLGCTQTFMLSPLAGCGDLDGGYILESPYEAGFGMNEKGYSYLVERTGLGVRGIDEQEKRKSE